MHGKDAALTSPYSGPPGQRRATPGPGGRHRSDPPSGPDGDGSRPTGPRPYVPSARRTPADPPPPPPDPAAGRYRSLKDMSAEQPPPAPRQTAPAKPTLPEALQQLSRPAEQPRRRWTGRRWAILGSVAAVLVIVLLAGGYLGYRALAPYYGLGYVSGRSATVESVTLTTTSVRCALSEPPFGESGEPHGTYCAIVISAHNVGRETAAINLRTWTADLDVGLTHVEPVTEWLAFRNEILEPGARASYQIAYDIPKGARLERLHLVVGDHSGTIATS